MTIPSRAAYQVTSDTDPPRYVPGYWYTMMPTTALAAGTTGINSLRLMPWMVRNRVRVSALGVRVTTGAAGLMQMGIYRANATTLDPMNQPVCTTGDIDISVAQNVNGAVLGGPITIGPGLHWVGTNNNIGGLVMQGFPNAGPGLAVLTGAPTQNGVSGAATTATLLKFCQTPSTVPYGTWPDANACVWSTLATGAVFIGQFQVAS